MSDAAWDAIELGHGVLHLPASEALAHGLAPSRAWKPNRTEAVYAFAAYHALHCTVLVRRFLRDHVRDGKPPGEHTWSHAWHCMEVLREEIMCTADGTIQSLPLDPGDRSKALLAGHGETRQCADWTHLREFSVSLEFLEFFVPSRATSGVLTGPNADQAQCWMDIGRGKRWAGPVWRALSRHRWHYSARVA